jgi:hypothetical protein
VSVAGRNFHRYGTRVWVALERKYPSSTAGYTRGLPFVDPPGPYLLPGLYADFSDSALVAGALVSKPAFDAALVAGRDGVRAALRAARAEEAALRAAAAGEDGQSAERRGQDSAEEDADWWEDGDGEPEVPLVRVVGEAEFKALAAGEGVGLSSASLRALVRAQSSRGSRNG